ncbi:MAG TPA: sensor histidine kinase [Actinomycetes bacterium]|jgi:signal transduction histidine kinase|nr:sensor histidine kinase [Actinomycetes bacterium]
MKASRPKRLARDLAGLVDVLLAFGIALVQVLTVMWSERFIRSPDWRDPDALAYLLLAAGPLALLVRRRWPLWVLATALACGLAYAARTYPEGPSQLAVYPALWTVAMTRSRRTAWLAATWAALAVAGAELFLYGDTMFDGEPLYAAVTVFAAMWWAEGVRARRAYVAELRDRAERAERTREEEARRRVDEERMRIARELHDVVSHTIGVISVQAGVAAHLLHRRPDKAADSLAAIRQASDEALGELHAMLGVLREGGGEDGRAPLAPAPGLAELDTLVAQAAGAGVEVTVSLEGEPRRLPPAVDLAAYRVVQESLTNVARHAGASRAEVSVRHSDGRLVVEVTDDGRARPGNGPGNANGNGSGQGILGMRERARALGGSLEAGPRPGGGFRVQATLPVGAP